MPAGGFLYRIHTEDANGISEFYARWHGCENSLKMDYSVECRYPRQSEPPLQRELLLMAQGYKFKMPATRYYALYSVQASHTRAPIVPQTVPGVKPHYSHNDIKAAS